MKYFPLTLLYCLFLLAACKTEPKAKETEQTPEVLSIPEKIAQAHGYENWKSVKEIQFTFNVDRDSTHFERSWTWKPKTNDIISISNGDTLAYSRKSMDSIALKRNGGFINDRFWVLAPFNLIWDANNYSFEHSPEEIAPISEQKMQKLTIVYGNEGGYTPGDAYDFYFQDDYILKEWVFRKSNQEEPSTTTTWEDYVTMGGLLLAQDHRTKEPGFSLNFTGLSVTAE